MLAAILVLYGAGVTTTIAQPPDTVTAVCSGCHGEAGISSNPMVPTLAGQPYTLIEDNLLAFRNGLRACSPERNDGSPPALLAQTMCATVSSLSDQEIAALAAYFEALPFEPARQSPKGPARSGRPLTVPRTERP
jgi:cytochrome c553